MRFLISGVILLTTLSAALGVKAQEVNIHCAEPQSILYRNQKTSTLWNKSEFPGSTHDQYVMNYQTVCTTQTSAAQTGPLPKGAAFDELIFSKILRPYGGPSAKKLISGPELIGQGLRKTVYLITTRTGSDAADKTQLAQNAANENLKGAAIEAIRYEIDMTVTITTNDTNHWIIDWHANNEFCNGELCPEHERHNIRLMNVNLKGSAQYASDLDELGVTIDIEETPGTGFYKAKLTGLTRLNNPTKGFIFNVANKIKIHSDDQAKQKLVDRAGWQFKELLNQTMTANNVKPMKPATSPETGLRNASKVLKQ